MYNHVTALLSNLQLASPLTLDIGEEALWKNARWVHDERLAQQAYCEIVFGGLPGDVELHTAEASGPVLYEPSTVCAAIQRLLRCGRLASPLSVGISTRANDRPRAAQVLMVNVGQDRLPPRKDVLLALPPTFRVIRLSGRDLFWRLNEPLDLRDPDELRWYEVTSRRLARALRGSTPLSPAWTMLRPPGAEEGPWLPHPVMDTYFVDRVYTPGTVDLTLDELDGYGW